MPTASPRPPTTVLESSWMKPSASAVYLTSSSDTFAVLTLDEGRSARDEVARADEGLGVEHDVAVHPQHAAVLRGLQGTQEATWTLVWSYCSL